MDYEAAIAVFDKELSIDPGCEAAYYGKDSSYYALGDYDAVIEMLQEGMQMVEDAARLQAFLEEISGVVESQGMNGGGQGGAWESTNEEEVSVSETGLLTCQGMAGCRNRSDLSERLQRFISQHPFLKESTRLTNMAEKKRKMYLWIILQFSFSPEMVRNCACNVMPLRF